MSKEKQIEEMVDIVCDFCVLNDGHCGFINNSKRCPTVLKGAEVLYNAGYRKQSEGEWIRYPHNSGIYCSLCKHKRRYLDINDAYCPNCGAKMKGGAE